MPLRHRTRPYTPEEWAGHVEALDMYLTQFQGVDPTDPVALADATQDVAGLLAAASHRDGLDEATRAVFDRAARQVGRHAQLKHRTPTHNTTSEWVTLAAGLFITATMPTNTAASQAMLLMSTLRLIQALADLYRQVDQTNTARLILRDTSEAFRTLHGGDASLQAHQAAQAQFETVAAQDTPLQTDTLPTTDAADDDQAEVDTDVLEPVGAPTGPAATVDDAASRDIERARHILSLTTADPRVKGRGTTSKKVTPRAPKPTQTRGPHL